METATQPKVIYLKDYQSSDFLIDQVFLNFELAEESTTVQSTLLMRRNPAKTKSNSPLVLNGEEMLLKSIRLNDKELPQDRYKVNAHTLTIMDLPDKFKLETVVEIKPQLNTRLSGLYKSGGNFCTQCESRGFRRITYYLDRPDILSRFTTTISADKKRYPLLLSNGNLMEHKDLDNGRHWVKWEDPSLKPCYLFALVAGDLDSLEDKFITKSGREIQLNLYVERGKLDQAPHAMDSLKKAMRWDEQAFNREYDLNNYMVVAVGDFNFGAMENKGLNIFNDKFILAKPETATDDDYIGILSVIGHEYFHNWSGNRVTVRDWFQITLKEGLTVFREQNFTRDMMASGLPRIQDVKQIRGMQFSQDASPMAHPIMPDSYIEVNNFYTVTVYEKGAEVIRMMSILLGSENFKKAMELYFTRNDGKAVTTEDFVKAMEDASGIDLTQFRRWYHQAGTPILNIIDDYDAQSQTYTLTVTQSCPATPGQPHKEPFHIPLAMALFDPQTKQEIPLQLENEAQAHADKSRVLSIKKPMEVFRFINVKHKPIPSLLRDFSAPVKLNYPYSQQDLIFLMKADTDEFNRWDASQQLAINLLLKLIKDYQQGQPLQADERFVQALAESFEAEMLILPSEAYLSELMTVIDVDAIYHARKFLKQAIAEQLKNQFLEYYQQHQKTGAYELTPKAVNERRLKNVCLYYLTQTQDEAMYRLCLQQFHQANNMTDTMGALNAMIDIDSVERTQMLDEFYTRWQKEILVIDKWLSLQAISTLPGALDRVKALLHHPAFDSKNPNRVRALISVFTNFNPLHFHNPNGAGYEFLTEQVLKFDAINPQLAARLLQPLSNWQRYDKTRAQLMKVQLQRIAATPHLSNDVYEIVEKSLK